MLLDQVAFHDSTTIGCTLKELECTAVRHKITFIVKRSSDPLRIACVNRFSCSTTYRETNRSREKPTVVVDCPLILDLSSCCYAMISARSTKHIFDEVNQI